MLAWFSPSAWALSPGPHPVLCNAMLPFSFTMTIGSSVSAGALMRRIRGRELLPPACFFLGFSCFIPPLNPNVRRRRKRERESEREREQGNGKMTAEERIERDCTLKLSSRSATAGLVFVSRAAPPLLIHTHTVCVCLWTLPWLFWNNQVAAAVCDKCRFHSRNPSQFETPP